MGEADLNKITKICLSDPKDNDFERVGELTERNALAMHDTNTHANPPFNYLTDDSYEAMDFVRNNCVQKVRNVISRWMQDQTSKFFVWKKI